MKILYVALSYIPSRRASSVQVMKMCSALARRGHEVILVAKRGHEAVGDDHDHYAVERQFSIHKLARPPYRGGGVVYSLGLAAEIARHRRWADLIYCRDQIGAVLASRTRVPVVFEAHDVPASGWRRRVISHAVATRQVRVVAISDALKRDLAGAGVAESARIVVAHDACDPNRALPMERQSGHEWVVGYVGGLYPGRGIDLIVELATVMSGVTFRIVGGSDADLAFWRARCTLPNVEFVGFQPQARLPSLYANMDVLVMPYSRSGVLSETRSTDTSRWASPMKMFEYMASGVPLVSSDLPVLREVLRDGENALFASDRNVTSWRTAIERLLSDRALRTRLASRAHADLVEHFTWDARAKKIMTALELETAG